MAPKSPVPKTEAFVKWFRSATPYIHRWGGATLVIAFGGDGLSARVFQHLPHDIHVLVSLEVRRVLVHGTRPPTAGHMRQHGGTPRSEMDPRATHARGGGPTTRG